MLFMNKLTDHYRQLLGLAASWDGKCRRFLFLWGRTSAYTQWQLRNWSQLLAQISCPKCSATLVEYSKD